MKNLKTLASFALILFSGIIYSAPPPPPTGGPACWPPPCIPVDNGVIFLIAAGLLFGAKKLYDLRKKSSPAC